MFRILNNILSKDCLWFRVELNILSILNLIQNLIIWEYEIES